jgi:hypothetical protein
MSSYPNILRYITGFKTYIIVLDATGSMGDSFDAVRLAIQTISQILHLCGWKIVVITYGDYCNSYDTLNKVTSVYTIDQFISYNFSSFLNGSGGDNPEAVATAFWRLEDLRNYLSQNGYDINNCSQVIFITDAPYHDLNGQGKYEKNALERINFPFPWPQVHVRVIESGITLSTICTTDTMHYYTNFGTLYHFNILKTSCVLVQILYIINNLFATNVQAFDFSKIPLDEFCYSFQKFVRDNPNLLEHLMFFAEQYYKTIHVNKHLLESHSLFCKQCETLGIPAGIMKMFKDAQSVKINQKDLYDTYSGPCIISNEYGSFGEIKDLFGGNIPDFMQRSKILIRSLMITDEKNGIPLAAIAEHPELVCSVFCIKDGQFPEFTQGVLTLLTSAVLQYSNIPQLTSIFVEYGCSDKFLRWLSVNLSNRTKPQETIWNRVKLQYILLGMTRIARIIVDDETQSNLHHLERIHIIMNVLKRFDNIVEICSFNDYIPRLNVKRILTNMTKQDAAFNTVHVPMFYDVLLKLWMVSTIAFKQTHQEVLRIVDNMRSCNHFYNKTENHFQQIIRLSEECNGLVLSIYSINCHIREDTRFPEFDGRRRGYMDNYSLYSFVNDEFVLENSPPSTYDELLNFYNTRIGLNGENIFTFQNLVHRKFINSNGPEMTICSKKGCTNIFCRQDSSALGKENTRCGICRTGIKQLPVYENTCSYCNRGFISGINVSTIQQVDCPFCLIPETTKMITTIPIMSLMRQNCELFANHFGIPIDIFDQIVQLQSVAKLFRTIPNDPDTTFSIPDTYFNEHLWKKTNITNDSIITYNCDTLSADSVGELLQNIENRFLIECSICYQTVKHNTSWKICQNKWCFNRFCETCIGQLVSKITPGSQINVSDLQCPMCRVSIKPGLFGRGTVQLKLLFDGQKNERPYDKMLANEQLHIFLCSNVGSDNQCVSDFPFYIDTRIIACGEEADTSSPKYCTACTKRNAEQNETNSQQVILGELTETGHYHHVDDDIHTYSRQCPTCKYLITHDGGCFHMTCTHCATHFCWCCGLSFDHADPWSSHPIYTHLNECNAVEIVHDTHIGQNYNYYATQFE